MEERGAGMSETFTDRLVARIQELEAVLAKAEQERDAAVSERDRIAAAYQDVSRERAGYMKAVNDRDAAVADNAAWETRYRTQGEELADAHAALSRETPAESLRAQIARLVADNAALVAEIRRVHRWANKVHQKDLASEMAQLLAAPHPGTALLEQHRKDVERLSAALADVQRKVENWAHGESCAREVENDDDEPKEPGCDCGKSELLAIITPPDGSLPGAAFLARRDAMATELKEARLVLARARNEGLERAAARISEESATYRDKAEEVARGNDTPQRRHAYALAEQAADTLAVASELIRALKEPEE
jgi:hypothetical protein